MKLKKILSGFLAAAMAVTTMVTAAFNVSAADDVVLGKKVTGADIAVSELSDATQVKVSFTITEMDSSAYATLKVCVNGDPWKDDTYATPPQYASGAGQSWQAKHEVTATGDQVSTLDFSPADWGYEIYLATDNTSGFNAKLTKIEFLNASGAVVASFDPNAASIGKDNFTYSSLTNTSMAVGDSFTITYDSDNTPDTAKYAIKYEVDKTEGSGVDYYTAVDDTGAIVSDSETPTGLRITESTQGKVTTYTFTAVAASVNAFQVKIESSATGDWSDINYLWYEGMGKYQVIASTYTVTIDSAIEHGSVTADPEEAASGVTVTLTVIPDEGYVLDTLTVTPEAAVTDDSDNAAKKTFTMPGEDVTVSAAFKPAEVALTGIELNKTAATVAVGKTVTLTATKKPANTTDETAVTFESDTPAVASVDAATGVVTGVSAGTAKITAKCGTKTAECTVTVTADAKPCTEITLNETTAEVKKGESVTLTATVTPTDTTDEITWTTSDAAVASVASDGKVTGVARGTATITATCGDMTAQCEVSVIEDKTVTPPVSVGGQKKYDVVTTVGGKQVKTVDTVYAISEADLQCKGYKVTITNTANGKSITKEITDAYKKVTVPSAENLGNDTFAGYYLVVRVKNVPKDVTLTYSFEKIS